MDSGACVGGAHRVAWSEPVSDDFRRGVATGFPLLRASARFCRREIFSSPLVVYTHELDVALQRSHPVFCPLHLSYGQSCQRSVFRVFLRSFAKAAIPSWSDICHRPSAAGGDLLCHLIGLRLHVLRTRCCFCENRSVTYQTSFEATLLQDHKEGTKSNTLNARMNQDHSTPTDVEKSHLAEDGFVSMLSNQEVSQRVSLYS